MKDILDLILDEAADAVSRESYEVAATFVAAHNMVQRAVLEVGQMSDPRGVVMM